MIVMALTLSASAQTAPAAMQTATTAQKIGHINSNALLSKMPEIAKADTAIGIYQQELTRKGEAMAKAFKTKATAYQTEYQAGKLAPLESEKQKNALIKEQQDLQAYGQDAEQKVTILRKQLLQPVLNKVNDAIKAVAKENGMDYILDSGSGTLFFSDASKDVTDAVKKKLGMN